MIRRCVTELLRRAEVILGSAAMVKDGVPDRATPVATSRASCTTRAPVAPRTQVPFFPFFAFFLYC
jgi:hypothetical protein